jgi:hypothetical protein
MPIGITRLVIDFEKCFAGDVGDGMGEKFLSSENVVVDDAGEVFPPHPKKDPSLDAPGDLGCGFSELLILFASKAAPRASLSGKLRFGGAGFAAKRDIVPERERCAGLESSYV